ncbi:MAG: hypothetical protein IPP73_12665, partial [Chitinophagaceae bacterium]|nr:hypothetical protein [Chitinophagaceae bacterium]
AGKVVIKHPDHRMEFGDKELSAGFQETMNEFTQVFRSGSQPTTP